MDRSSRFISLSGLSGVAAGACALVGAWYANRYIGGANDPDSRYQLIRNIQPGKGFSLNDHLGGRMFLIACCTFAASFLLALLFTWLRSRKTGVPLMGAMSRRLAIAVGIPLLAGAFYVVKLMQYGAFGMIAPGCLLFYGLGLIAASRYTLGEIKYLGYCQVLLGITNLFFPAQGIYFWAFGFGILHIAYGIYMWFTYERARNQ